MSYFEDFIEPHLGEFYGYDYDGCCGEVDIDYTNAKFFTGGQWGFYEHPSTEHLRAIVGFLEKHDRPVPEKLPKLIDERIKDMF